MHKQSKSKLNSLKSEYERKLSSNDELTTLIRNKGIETWQETITFVKSLPYGRNSNRSDLKLVVTEEKGSCSSKHALLKKVADLNNIPNVKLMLGMYRMSEKNTPKIGNILIENSIECIAEAHCYLNIDNERIDVTTCQSDFGNIENDILEELEIEVEQVSKFKVEYHKEFLRSWLKNTNTTVEFEQIWNIREKCIERLTR